MFAKLLMIILAAGAIASTLLVVRQQKVETIHEISRAYLRQRQYQRVLWQLQVRIAEQCRPDVLRERLLEQNNDWRPIPALPTLIDERSDDSINDAELGG